MRRLAEWRYFRKSPLAGVYKNDWEDDRDGRGRQGLIGLT